jgi:uncharacterized protein
VQHRNVEKLRQFLDAYAHRGDVGAGLADDALWHVGGDNGFSGDYRGKQAVLGYFDRVIAETAATIRLEPIEMMANDERGAAFLRVTADRGDRHLDVTMAEAFVFDGDGRIREFWAHANDQQAVDAFWGRDDR